MKSLVKFVALFLWACSVRGAEVSNFSSENTSSKLQITEIIHDGSQFIAVGSGTADRDGFSRALILSSKDGFDWKQSGERYQTRLDSIAHGNNASIAVGYEYAEGYRNLILRSKNKGKWERLPIPNNEQFERAPDIAFGNGKFVIISSQFLGVHVLVSENNGDSWYPIDMGRPWHLAKIELSNGHFIAYGDGSDSQNRL